MTLSKEEKEYVKWGIGIGVKTAEVAYTIMLHRTRTAHSDKYNHSNHTLRDTQEEFTNLKIEINKTIAKM